MVACAFWLALQNWDQWIEKLGAPDIAEREEAEFELRRAPSDVLRRPHADVEVRHRLHRLLRERGAPCVLVDDLRSDDVAGNAKAARNRLIRAYSPEARDELLRTLKSPDDQQTIQSAFILAVMGDGRAALAADPAVVRRILAAFFRGECEDFEWVAVHGMLRLWPMLPERERRPAVERGLAGVPPHAMGPHLDLVRDVARQLRMPFPREILDRYLLCLRDNNRSEDAFYCRLRVRALEGLAIPSLRDRLADPDPQMRRFASQTLLSMGVEDLPTRTLVEALQWDLSMRSRILLRGREALRDLDLAAGSRNRLHAARALRTIAEIDPSHPGLLSASLSHLGTDLFDRNGMEAMETLVRIGDRTSLRSKLASDDEQECALAALALSRLDEDVDEEALKRIVRFAARDLVDESSALPALLARPGWQERIDGALRRLGPRGRRRAEVLEPER